MTDHYAPPCSRFLIRGGKSRIITERAKREIYDRCRRNIFLISGSYERSYTVGFFKKKEKRGPEEKQAVLTVYACRRNSDDVSEHMADILKDTVVDRKEIEGGTEFILQDGSAFRIHIMDGRQTQSHAAGMAGFFSQAPLSNEKVKKSVIQQIALFNCVTGIEFTLNDDDNRTEYLVVAVYLLAVRLNGFVLHPNMYLYRSDKKLLISADGKTDFEEYIPQADSSILDKDIEEEQADIDRRERSQKKCRDMGIPYAEHLKASVYESECTVPSKEKIIKRLACVFAAAVCSEACNYEPEKAKDMIVGMLGELEEKYSVTNGFSMEEREYVENPLGHPDLHPKFGWRYECCAVLLWALGLWELGEPDKICDAGDIGKIMWNNDSDSLNEKSALKSKTEILDMQDVIFRYNWACVDARIHHKEMSAVDGEIVYEWHYALNWLTNANQTENWDDIRTNT